MCSTITVFLYVGTLTHVLMYLYACMWVGFKNDFAIYKKKYLTHIFLKLFLMCITSALIHQREDQ